VKVLLCILAVLLIGTETVFVAPLLDMANIPDAREQMLVAFGIVAGCVVCLENAVNMLDKAHSWRERLLPGGILLFLVLFLMAFGLMRGLMTYSLSHGQLKLFLMGAYWINLLFWSLITFLPPMAAALLFHQVREKKEEPPCATA
jgi:lysylphosphatidylglycerol synthetase-like protein (DUF2156 family)